MSTEAFIQVKSFGSVRPKNGTNSRSPYEHQKCAMKALDQMNEEKSFRTLIVLPTGGGKTYTAATWLLKNAIDKKKKILWIAHRQMLLDQAAESFQRFAYTEVIPHTSSFVFRIVSGSTEHDRACDIKQTDDLLMISKDSLGRNLDRLDKWLAEEKEIFFIVDEAHHATAKTYRRIIDYVSEKVPQVKLIGLTATPFRTAEEEKGLLSKIFTDGLKDGRVVHGDSGITYQIGLKELINRQILSKPYFEYYATEQFFGDSIGVDDWSSITNFDMLPEDIAFQMAESAARNRLIVQTYINGMEKYGQTILFAINVTHAIHLAALFKKAGIPADFIVSSVKDMVTGVTINQKDNERNIEAYRHGELKVLINVNILTEGIDLPQTKTVFLARPTVSSILMTQMVGRALRGTAAGGTAEAHIVSFVDYWNEHIAWVNPESLFEGNNDFKNTQADYKHRDLRLISIAKIQEFANLLDNNVDTRELERVPFEKRIPLGMYAFNIMDHSYQVMVYDSTKKAYENLMESLPALFDSFHVREQEELTEEQLETMEEQCRDTYFYGEMIPPYEPTDVWNILSYFAQYDEAPKFYTFEQIDRSKLDVAKIAKTIWDEDMGGRRRKEYIDSLWENEDDNMLAMFFGHKAFFLRQVDIELMKLSHREEIFDDTENVTFGRRHLTDLPLYEIGRINPQLEQELRDTAFENSRDQDGNYCCAACGMNSRSKIFFQVDHIIPMNDGGKSVADNLQILCRTCNGLKRDGR